MPTRWIDFDEPDDEPPQGPAAAVDADEIRAALGRVLHSADFHASARQHRLITYLVDEALAGRGRRLKAYNIATAVLGRSEDFDPQTDPVVRVEAGYVRRSLERYYL